MRNGGRYLTAAAVIAITGCIDDQGKVQIRSTATPLSAQAKPVSARVAEGNGLLALGNVGLALESFRVALRDEPGSIDALVGMAACYERMGRFDLSRRQLEAALAVEPGNAAVLTALAQSLDGQNRHDEAASVRREIASRAGIISPAPTVVAAETRTPLAAPDGNVDVALTSHVLAGSSVTISLPPARIIAAEAPLPPRTAPAPQKFRPTVIAEASGPRLERVSLGVVALVTVPTRQWQSQVVRQTAQATTIRFVPLRPAEPRFAMVRLLNAARYQGLAARTRTFLADRGWRQLAIGDAPAIRQTSLILYPAAKQATARRLASQFGFAIAQRTTGTEIVMLLGRDAARPGQRRAGG